MAHRAHLAASTALALILTGQPALAQTSDVGSASEDTGTVETPDAVSDIIVTATRTNREGYTAPTPTTVISLDQIQQSAPASLADYVNQLPALVGSTSPRNNNGTTSGGTAGSNLLSLRNLGVNRTLVLLDGRRVVPSTLTGAVDVNTLPTSMVQRVDVVTGGASAAWGSDAVAGVVNFILDDKYTGIKGEANYGVTEKGDGSAYRLELTGGMPFAGGRGHIVVSGQYAKSGRVQARDRDWYDGSKLIPNPGRTATNGAPQYIVAPNVGLASATDNGLITSGPLRGTQFGANGLASPTPFNFGYTANLQSLGGTAEDQGGRIELAIPTETYSVFGHASFELTDAIQAYGEASYGHGEANYLGVSYNRFGNVTIRANNAYLDPAVRRALQAAGQTSFSLGTSNYKFGQIEGRNTRALTRFVGGLKGDLGGWKWDVYYERGVSKITSIAARNPIVAAYNKATDAVLSSGSIVCGVNGDASPANDDAACVPFNVFGSAAPSDAAFAYVTGTAEQHVRITQDVASGSISGEPFSTWAGPVSLVVGAEYRKETYRSTADAISQATGFFTGNYKASTGDISVREGFAEIIVPLLKDTRFFRDVSFNGAVRYTDYDPSGGVTTWKAGLTWDVTSELRLRGTRSRDIRAPNLNELYQGGQATTSAFVDPVLGTGYAGRVFIIGNRELTPERADTLSFGVGYRPEWLRGLSLSVDYYDIKLSNAIVTLNSQNLIDGCFGGSADLCPYITRDPSTNMITEILTPGINFSSERATGVDIEASYSAEVGPGRLGLSVLANYVKRRDIDTGFTVYQYADTLSDNTAVPKWRGTLNANYRAGGTSLNLRERFISAGRYSRQFTIADNHVKAAYYTDLTLTHEFEDLPGKPALFLSVENLFDQAPRVTPQTIAPVHINTGVNGTVYDVLGRNFRAGVRFGF
ncbi:TonB-dependent receptor [Novosphingobium sp. RD2P27]|uniref:TonB-dependent receptor n=1 Tax=Novosphingobium kalidii TaxID=3230299 RepID=A0ABV2D331_9SPHN